MTKQASEKDFETTLKTKSRLGLVLFVITLIILAGSGGFLLGKLIYEEKTQRASPTLVSQDTVAIPTTQITPESTNVQKLTDIITVFNNDATGAGNSNVDYVSFDKCNQANSSCEHYLLRKDRVLDFPILIETNGIKYVVSGKIESLGVATGHHYYELVEDVEMFILAVYDDTPSDVETGDVSYFSFKSCSLEMSVCIHLLLDEKRVDEFQQPFADVVKISGEHKGHGAATGNWFFELTSNVKIEPL